MKGVARGLWVFVVLGLFLALAVPVGEAAPRTPVAGDPVGGFAPPQDPGRNRTKFVPCKVKVTWVSAEFWVDNEDGQDEYTFNVTVSGNSTEHAINVPGGQAIPHEVAVGKVVYEKERIYKGFNVSFVIKAHVTELDGLTPNDHAHGRVVVTARCPQTIQVELSAINLIVSGALGPIDVTLKFKVEMC